MRAGLKITGLDQLTRKLDKMVASVDGRKQGDTLGEAAQPFLERMQQLVPVLSGGLRDSLGIAVSDDGLTAQVGPIGKDAWRAHFVEFGTVKMAAQPFIRPAFDAGAGNVTAKVARQMRSDILKAAKG